MVEIVQLYYMNSKDYYIAFTNYKIVNREDGYALMLGEQSNIQIIIYYVNYDCKLCIWQKTLKGKYRKDHTLCVVRFQSCKI